MPYDRDNLKPLPELPNERWYIRQMLGTFGSALADSDGMSPRVSPVNMLLADDVKLGSMSERGSLSFCWLQPNNGPRPFK